MYDFKNNKIIIANYRFFVSGGPEVYMFKFMDLCKRNGIVPIPFSVDYSMNKKSDFSKYFIHSRSKDSVYFNQINKINPLSVYRTLEGFFYNHEAYSKIKKLIHQERPKALYALQVINTLSPSVFKAAKEEGLKVVHRISDFNLVCPSSMMLKNFSPCDECLSMGLDSAIKNKCVHESKMLSKLRVSSMKQHISSRIYDNVDYFVTPTKFTREILIKGGFNQNKIVQVPTFIDSSIITPEFSHDNYVLFLGRMVPEKGVKYAIEAMKIVSQKSSLKLVITGENNKLPKELRDYIDYNGLSDRIIFTGFLQGDSLKKIISHCLCVLCPAIWYENMPNTILEAYAYGKPVIASNIGSFPEVVLDGKTGFLFNPKDSVGLANKILELNNDNMSILMGESARKLVEKEYNPDLHFNRIMELLG